MKPINPELVIEDMIRRQEVGSYGFWTDPLDIYGGKSRMEVWTLPVDLGNMNPDKGGISFNYFEPRGEAGRRHAGLDIHMKPNSPIHAVTDGIVVYQGYYASGQNTGRKVYRVMVANFDGSLVLYGEMHDMPIATGTVIRQGDIIGYTKRMDVDRMLHIEVYENAEAYLGIFSQGTFDSTDATKYDNVKDAPFQRRPDLINPTMFGALRVYQGYYDNHAWKMSPNYKFMPDD